MRAGLLAVVLIVFSASTAAFAQTDPLARAHEQYNRGDFDEAIRSAAAAREAPGAAPAAAIVLSRAYLERYRVTQEPADLEAARALLLSTGAAGLAGRTRVDWTIGMGQLLYFDRRFGTAAEFFEIGLAHADGLEPGARDRLFDWWAEALDQQAVSGPAADRSAFYRRVLLRADEELRRDDPAAAASYWLVKAALGLEDFDRAWAAGEAGWLRAVAASPDGDRLRDDLDRLVLDVVIPQRARAISPENPRAAAQALQDEWNTMKARYAR